MHCALRTCFTYATHIMFRIEAEERRGEGGDGLMLGGLLGADV